MDKICTNWLVVMNLAYSLNACPPSSLNKRRLPETWPMRKMTKNKPVKAISNFRPKVLFKVFDTQLINCFFYNFFVKILGVKFTCGKLIKQSIALYKPYFKQF